MQERQLQENIRQFNENMALQREQLYSRFNSGSGGGGSTSSGTNDSEPKETTYKDTGKYVNIDLKPYGKLATGTMRVYQGSDGKRYFKYNGKYIPI